MARPQVRAKLATAATTPTHSLHPLSPHTRSLKHAHERTYVRGKALIHLALTHARMRMRVHTGMAIHVGTSRPLVSIFLCTHSSGPHRKPYSYQNILWYIGKTPHQDEEETKTWRCCFIFIFYDLQRPVIMP